MLLLLQTLSSSTPLLYCVAVLEQIHSPCASGCHHAAPADADVAGPSSEGADPSGPNGPYSRATLVICPLVAVIQWRQEIARYVAPNALRVNDTTPPFPPAPPPPPHPRSIGLGPRGAWVNHNLLCCDAEWSALLLSF